jgi:hypothetical protein
MADLSHYKAIAVYLSKHKPLIKSVLGFEQMISLFELKVAEAEAIMQVVVIINLGRNAGDNHVKNSLCSLTASIAHIARIYAIKSNDEALLQQTSFSLADLQQAKDRNLIDLCLAMHKEAKKHSIQLLAAGLEESTLNILKTVADVYDIVVLPPKFLSGLTDTYESRITQLINDSNKILTGEIDVHIGLMAKQHKEFCTGYFSLRKKIKGLTSVSRKQKG